MATKKASKKEDAAAAAPGENGSTQEKVETPVAEAEAPATAAPPASGVAAPDNMKRRIEK